MKTLSASSALLGFSLLLWGQALGTGAPVRVAGVEIVASTPMSAAAPSSPVPSDGSGSISAAALADVVDQYCVRCHNERRMTGNLTLEGFDPVSADEHADIAEKMIVKLRAGMMPPPGARRPEADTLQELVETLESVIDARASRASRWRSGAGS